MFCFEEQTYPFWGFALLALVLHGCMQARQRPSLPIVGRSFVIETGMISNFRFYKNAEAILVEGYTKVGYDL